MPHQPPIDRDGGRGALRRIEVAIQQVDGVAWPARAARNLALNRGNIAEAQVITQTVFETLGQKKNDLLARTILCTAPLYAVLNGAIEVAEQMAEEMVQAAQALGQPSGLAYAYYARGFVLSYGRHDHEAAIAALSESIDLTHAGASDTIYPHALSTLAREQLRANLALEGVASLQLALAHTRSGILHIVYLDPEVEPMMAMVRERLSAGRLQRASARGAAMGYDEIVTSATDSCSRILSRDLPSTSPAPS
jgi:hypothetical protein